MTSASLATWLAIVITAVWVLSLIGDAVWTTYDPPVSIHALMMAAAGWAFAGGYIRKQERNGDG